MAYVYRHIRLDKNVPFYIGMSKNDDDYFRAYTKHGRHNHWKNIVSKTEYEVEILVDGITHEEAVDTEMYFIRLYGRVDLKTGTLCNRTDGGEGIKNPNAEFRNKISMLKKGNKNSLGLKHSEETKRIISIKAKLRPRPRTSQATKDKLSKIHKGRKISAQQIEKMKLALKGRKAYNKGLPMPLHQYELLLRKSEELKIRVSKYSLSGGLIKIYPSLIEAAKDNHILQGNITHACNKKIMYGGYIWRYANECSLVDIDAYDVRIKPVMQMTMNGEFVAEYSSAMHAARATGFQKSSILRVCRGMYKQAYNFKWEIKK